MKNIEKYKGIVLKHLSHFRKKVKYIVKMSSDLSSDYYDGEYIVIGIHADCELYFPDFEAESMYKNMELNMEYTLEELGLEGE